MYLPFIPQAGTLEKVQASSQKAQGPPLALLSGWPEYQLKEKTSFSCPRCNLPGREIDLGVTAKRLGVLNHHLSSTINHFKGVTCFIPNVESASVQVC